ncbi:hypothetical protein [Streptomyces sp. Go-475]|uniref:RICIN domain-containing protein n=1 Tax=Streptomyces sp. Go-475 TaxID=2072505 RepID=UPI0018E5047B|nr:hypothetical protein [Streptomyces sp. Go-475]
MTFTADNPDLRATGNVTNGLALDSGGNVASGSNLKQWTYGSSTNLLWTFAAL